MVLTSYYEGLAEQGDIKALARAALFDERVYDVISRRPHLVDALVAELPSPLAARVLARGCCYAAFSDATVNNLVTVSSYLSRQESCVERTALAELLGNCGFPERHRVELFNYSETLRHLILSNNPFAQRGTLRCLAWTFCDDFLDDAVASLQYKTDILNHVNRVFTRTYDFVSWRFTVRVMSLAGGFNEDRVDVYKTERLTALVTKAIPEFGLFFTFGLLYGLVRHYPRRLRGAGLVPRWLARHRALWTGTVCGVLGVTSHSWHEFRLMNERARWDERYQQETRRRRGAEKRQTTYQKNEYFDSLEGVTRRVWMMQLRTYATVGVAFFLTLLPLPKVKFPAWMGDVVFRHPFVPRLFPVIVGLPTASRCLVPFVFAPFIAATLVTSTQYGATPYDHYVQLRYAWWQKYRAGTTATNGAEA